MNYKKGFIRIFVLGLIAAPIIGIFMNGDRYKMQYSVNYDRKGYLVETSKVPRCAAIIAQNPIKFPVIGAGAENYCLSLVFSWDEIKKYQSAQGNINAPVTDRVIRDAMDAEVDDAVASMRYADMFAYTVYYLTLCLAGLIVFYLGKWIIKGFKSP